MSHPDRVLEFLSSQIESVEQLEILALLYEQPSRDWTAESLSRELRSSESAIAKRLASLVSQQILLAPDAANPRFRPFSQDAESLVHEAITFYRQRPHRVLEILYSRSNSAMQSFANSFRLKKDKP